jgi:hypothetical protein
MSSSKTACARGSYISIGRGGIKGKPFTLDIAHSILTYSLA